MITVLTTNILAEDELGKKAYIEAKHDKFERVLKAGNPDRDKSKDSEIRSAYIEHQYLIATSNIPEISVYDIAYITTPFDTDVDTPDRNGLLVRAQSFKQLVDATFPLIQGESPIDEVLGFAGKQIYVKQVTNLATLYFTDESVVIEQGRTELAVPDIEVPAVLTENEKERAEALARVLRIALELGKGLNTVVPQPYKTVLSGVFGGFDYLLSLSKKPQHEQDNDLLIQRMAEVAYKAAWDANVRQTVAEQAGLIYSLIEKMAQGYGRQKKDKEKPEKLVDCYLRPYWGDLSDILNTLRKPKFAEASLPEYCLAASLQFSILQELAVLDDKHTNPFESQWCKALQEHYAPISIEHVRQIYATLVGDACKLVETTTEIVYTTRPFRIVQNCRVHFGDPASFHGIGWFYDNGYFGYYPQGFAFCHCPEHYQWAYDQCVSHRKDWIWSKQGSVEGKIINELGGFHNLANRDWTHLLTHPLYGASKY